jgi:lysozyme
MNLSIAEELCRRFEGLARVGKDGLVYPYICPAGFPTQGYGTVFRPDGRKVTMEDPPITKETAEQWLKMELLHTYAPGVVRQCPILLTLALSSNDWGKFNAIVDFAYNLGVGRLQTSTLKRKLNAQDWEGAKEQLMLWTRGGGKVLPGLVKRRQAEILVMGA